VQQPGLYFPYIRVRDDEWLKVAALYWPSVRRLVPSGYSKHDSPTARFFADAGLLEDEDPKDLLIYVTIDLEEMLSENLELLRRDFSVKRALANWDGQPWAERMASDRETPALGWIHATKFPAKTVDSLVNAGLARRGRSVTPRHYAGDPEDWIGLHPALANAYMTVLAERLSAQAGFEPLTDQVDLRVATPSGDVEAAMNLLLGRRRLAADPVAASMESYVFLALQHARPKNLTSASAKKIVKCRKNLAGELATFRNHVSSMRDELVELAALPIERRRLESFAAHVQQNIELPLQELEKGLRLHKLEPTRSLVLSGSFAPPAALGAGLAAGGVTSPTAAAAAGAVVAVGGAWWQVSKSRTNAKASSPVGYLLDVRDHLTPKTLTARARKILTGTYGRAQGPPVRRRSQPEPLW
jgi:hypothetical protein